MSSQVRPSFFCSRPNGSLTPLIALDDLPAGVTIRGISRTLTPGETQGMISCGTSESRSEPWTLEGVTPAGKDTTASNEDASELQAVLLKILSDDSVPTHLRMAINAILYRHSGASLSLAAPVTEAVTGRQSAPPVYYGNSRGHAYHKHNFNTKKEFCSFWIRHGECDYAQQGCMFKHEMPTDIAKLEKLGLRDIPRWYREKFSVPSLLQTNYGNLHRGEHNQAAGDHLANNAILNHPAANNAGTVGTSTHATGITNAANNASTSGPSGHANSTPKAAINASKAGSSDHSHNINNARTAGTSVYATGITKAANSASKAGPSGHTHGNGNVAHNAGQKNNGNNGNHNSPAHPRGGRSKTPRGAGFGADKSRGNSYWAKNGQRNGVTPPPANVDKETGGDDTPGSMSPNTSGGSSFSISSGAARIDLLATPMVDPMPNVSISGQHILDKDGMARKNAVTARLRRLTPEDTYGPIPEEEQEEPVRNFFRAKTRHVFNFGVDGTNKLAAAFDPYASPAEDETSGRATAPALTPMIRELVAASQPIDPNELLTIWGPIGEPVQRPAHATYAMALIKGQAENGFNGKFAYPYMGQH